MKKDIKDIIEMMGITEAISLFIGLPALFVFWLCVMPW